MLLTKKDFKKFGFKNVMVSKLPITVICGNETSARTYIYDSLNELKNEKWFKLALTCDKIGTPIIIYERLIDNTPYHHEVAQSSDKVIFRMFSSVKGAEIK